MAKKLIVCADGTWNNPSHRDRGKYRSSNVVKMMCGLSPRDEQDNDQVVFYEPGISTEGIVDPWVAGFTGVGLSRIVKAAYTFLINNYEPGDLVYCFGFSRGAFIVRSLSGLIGKVGLLRTEFLYRYNDAYDLYRRKDLEAESEEIQEFRSGRVHPDPIDDTENPFAVHFIGVWDTVGALGIPLTRGDRATVRGFAFHDARLNPYLPYAYHALAIDERRAAFAPTLWGRCPSAHNREIQQVWFAGSHADVGGGYEDEGLSNISFIWMQEKARSCGLCFDESYIDENYRGAQNHLGELRDSVAGFFSYLPKRPREIGVVDDEGAPLATGEHLHESVLMRREQMGAGYDPANLPPEVEERLPTAPYSPP